MFFFQGCFERHLLLQANTLANAGWSVHVAYPSHLSKAARALSERVATIVLPPEVGEIFKGRDALATLYADRGGEASNSVANSLRGVLPVEVDVVLAWENPTCFLRSLYPDALIVNQMPGAFCRPPFPNTVTFDVEGLYKYSTLASSGPEIVLRQPSASQLSFGDHFRDSVTDALLNTSPFKADDWGRVGVRNALLPLQISAHYAFRLDSGLDSQLDLIDAASKTVGLDDDLIVTQYRSKFANDITINPANLERYRDIWPNLVWNEQVDALPSPSQVVLPSMDSVITASSSVGLQAVVLGKPVHVIGRSHIAPFATDRLREYGVSADLAARRLSAFLSSSYQPLYSFVTSNERFLTALLEELLTRYRSGKKGVEALVDFTKIDRTYEDAFSTSFSTQSVVRRLSKQYPGVASRFSELELFEQLLCNDDVKVVSFDLFDTLICRPTENPSDVFHFLQLAVDERFGLRFSEFAKVRMDAENEARGKCPDPEISLQLIYDLVAERFDLSEEVREQILQIEIDLETKFIMPRPRGRDLWKAAQSSGKPIIIVSDMYLPHDVIEAMIQKAGYRGYAKLYVSSAHGARKKDGALFDIVLDDLGVPGPAVVHVGDHVVADIKNAISRDIRTLRTPRAIDILRKTSDFPSAYRATAGAGDVARSAVVGLTAAAIFDHEPQPDQWGSLFQGSANKLGYAALGPMYLGFALWLHDQAISDNITDLYFLSREGHLIKQVYDVVAEEMEESPASHYLYASRRATRVAAISTQDDALEVAAQPFTAGVRLSDLISQRFGLSEALIFEKLQSISISPYVQLEKTPIGRSDLVRSVRALMPEILYQAGIERNNYLSYLENMGLTDGRRFAVVDIGWKGNMQGSLGRLLGNGVMGYYFATLSGAERWRLEGHVLRAYLGAGIGPWSDNVISRHRHLMEALACNNDQSTVTVQKTSQGFHPILRCDPISPRHYGFVAEAHRGAVSFARDFTRSFAPFLQGLRVEPELATLALSHLMAKPKAQDARLMSSLIFEDGFGGVMPKSVLNSQASVWPEGSAALAADEAKAVTPTPAQKEAEPVTFSERAVDDAIARRPLERLLVHGISGERGKKKYNQHPDRFFQDSKSPFIRAWGRIR